MGRPRKFKTSQALETAWEEYKAWCNDQKVLTHDFSSKNSEFVSAELKRSVTCTNFDECGTRYPLPQYGDITATEEVCEHCGAPMVIVTTARGPWKLCPNFDCPGKEEEAAKKPARGKGRGRKAAIAKR